jgi:multidrug efflux pump subunit AcrB
MFEPMAITIIFGLAFATVLTLGLVPLLYSIFFRVSLDN